MQRHYRQILIIYRNGKENGKCFLTQTSAKISGSPTSERSFIQTSYNIHGHTLNETSKAKYLEVTIDNSTVTKKANQTSSCPKDVKTKCYKSIVRIVHRRTNSVTSMLQELGWEDLKSRREQNKVAMMYRIFNNLVEIPADQYMAAAGLSTGSNHQRFMVQYGSINAY